MKVAQASRTLATAIALGFLFSLVSVIVAIALSINDPTLHVPLEVHFAIWGIGAAGAFLVMTWRNRRAATHE
jgi:hypothetical protein